MKWLILLTYLLIVFAAVWYTMAPHYDGTVQVHSKYGEVTVYRDDNAIPHIFADNEDASLFGTGYVHAQDRIWIFEKFRRLSRGTWSEILGDEALPVDYLFRQFGFARMGKRAYKTVSPKFLHDYEVYVEGMNEYIRNNPLPIEFYILGAECEDFSVLDAIIIEKFIDFILSYNYQMEITREEVFKATGDEEFADRYMPYSDDNFLRQNFPSVQDEDLIELGLFLKDGVNQGNYKHERVETHYNPSIKDIYEDVRQTLNMIHFDGSNFWAISGKHTKSGKPILSNDPHLSNSLPTLWHIAEVSYGNFTQAGAFVLGQPYIMMGRSQKVALGLTAIHSDVIDLYQEKLVKNGTHYLYDGHEVPVKQTREIIKVRDFFATSGYRLETLIVNFTHHGPLVHDPFNKAYDFMKRLPYDAFGQTDVAMSWVGFRNISVHYSNLRCAVYSESVPDALNCYKETGTQNMNYIFADTLGNIGFMPIVSYPIRKNPIASVYIQDGTKSENDWQGFVPFEEIPKVINPKCGFIANANSMVTSQNVKYGLGAMMPSTPRVMRIQELITEQIKSGVKFTVEDMIRIQLDTIDVNARTMIQSLDKIFDRHQKYLLSQLTSESDKNFLTKFHQHLKGWNADFNVDSSQACLFAIWEKEYHSSILADQIPNKVLRETMANIPDSDIFLMDLLQHLETDKSYLSKYCASNITIFEDQYTANENKCLVTLAYNAVRAWRILERGVSTNPEEWRWGAIHKHYYEHLPFSLIPGLKQIFHREVEAGGSRRTINFALYDFYHNDLEQRVWLRSNFAANFRFAVDMASYEDPEKYNTYMSLDTGISGNIFSQHYFDMNEMHFKTSKPIKFGLENAKKNAKYTLRLEPINN